MGAAMFAPWPRYKMPLPADVEAALAAKDFSHLADKPRKDWLDDAIEELEKKVAQQRKQYKLTDFVYDASSERYWNLEDLADYSEKSVNSLVPRDEWEQEEVPGRNGSVRLISIKPASSIARIERNLVVEGVAWWPGKPRFIKDVIVTREGEQQFKGRRTLNLYVAPQHHEKGDPALAGVWIEHLKKLWPQDYELLLDYFAHTIQHPEDKINYGLVLLGAPGIGKDLSLLPVKAAVGEHNSKDVTPDNVASPYNEWVRSVLLVINEARSTESEFKATDFYEKLKPYLAAPPNWLVSNPKYGKQVPVRNLMRVIITTNDPLALFVSEDDRRLYFAESQLPKNWANSEYFHGLDSYYRAGGYGHVYAYLRQRDISKFDPKWVPAANAAHRFATDAWSFDDPIADAIVELGWPDLFFKSEIMKTDAASFDNRDKFERLLNSNQKMARAMNALGYRPHRSPEKSGWEFTAPGDKRFRSRLAYVKVNFTGDVEGELSRRGKEIAGNGNGKAAKPVPLKLVES